MTKRLSIQRCLKSRECYVALSRNFLMANSFLCPMPMDYNLLASEIRQETLLVGGLNTITANIDCTGFTYITIEVPSVSVPIKCTAVQLASDRAWSVSQSALWSCSNGITGTELSSGQSARFTKKSGSGQAYVGQVLTAVSPSYRFEGVVPSSMSVTLYFTPASHADIIEGGWGFAYNGAAQTVPYTVILRY